MNTIVVDAEGRAGTPGWLSPRTMVAGIIVAASLALAGLGFYWLNDGDPPAAATPAAAPQAASPTEAERSFAAPEPSCIDGKPAREGVSADACL